MINGGNAGQRRVMMITQEQKDHMHPKAIEQLQEGIQHGLMLVMKRQKHLKTLNYFTLGHRQYETIEEILLNNTDEKGVIDMTLLEVVSLLEMATCVLTVPTNKTGENRCSLFGAKCNFCIASYLYGGDKGVNLEAVEQRYKDN